MTYFIEFIASFLTTLVVFVISYYMFYKTSAKNDSSKQDSKEPAKISKTKIVHDDDDSEEKTQAEEEQVDVEDFKEFLIHAEELNDLQDDVGDVPESDKPFVDEEFAKNIHTLYKCSRLHIREMEEQMSEDEKEQERLAKQNQLEEIFKLMKQEEEKFGIKSVNDIQEQMKIYAS